VGIKAKDLKIYSEVDLDSIVSEESKPQTLRSGRFLKGPIPVEWLKKAIAAGVPALKIGLVLWYLHGLKQTWMRDSKMLLLSSRELKKWGISRTTKYQGIDQLKKAKLIQVKKSLRKNPQVKILQADGWL
jgi:hypothetical protein